MVFGAGQGSDSGSSCLMAACLRARTWILVRLLPAVRRHAGRGVTAMAAVSCAGLLGAAAAPAGGGNGAQLLVSRSDAARAAEAAAVSGARLWVRRYNGPGNSRDDAYAVAVSRTGDRVFVTGSSYGGSATGYDYATAAYDAATGARLWVARYNRTMFDDARAVAVSPDGSTVYVTGSDTVAYNAATGAQRWASIGGDAVAVAVSPDDSTVYVTGSGLCVGLGAGFSTVAHTAATGAQRWAASYCGPSGDHTYPSALAVSPDGSTVYVTGASDLSHSDSGDYATVAYNAVTGAQRWASLYVGPADDRDQANAVAVSPDGSRVYVTGLSVAPTSGALEADYATISYNAATGTQLWLRRYHGAGTGYDIGAAIAVSPAGKVLVTGSSWGATSNQDYATIAYSPDGTRQWVKRYNGPGNRADTASAVTAPGNGRVYVTGQSWGGSATRDDFATIAYSVFTGDKVWVRRYNGPSSSGDYASSMAARAGRLFVAGPSHGISSGRDYAIVAYNG
jgi:DNA-binding beta-propeller fold protein YncE